MADPAARLACYAALDPPLAVDIGAGLGIAVFPAHGANPALTMKAQNGDELVVYADRSKAERTLCEVLAASGVSAS